jgi:hypothetical protein
MRRSYGGKDQADAAVGVDRGFLKNVCPTVLRRWLDPVGNDRGR